MTSALLKRARSAAMFVALLGAPDFARAQGEGERVPIGADFVYQGRLVQAGVPVEDPHDFEFTLIDCATLIVVAGPVIQTLDPVNGLFTTSPPLNFGFAAWNGDERCLAIRVRPAGFGAFVALSPTQEVTPAPYALRAVVANGAPPTGAAGGDLTGNYPNPTIAANAVGSGEVIDNSLTAGDLANDSVGAAEIAAGAVGTSEVANNSLTSDDLAAGSVGTSELVDGAVGTVDLDPTGALSGDVLKFNGAIVDWLPDGIVFPFNGSAAVNAGDVMFDLTNTGTGRVADFVNTNAAAATPAVLMDSAGTAPTLQVDGDGTAILARGLLDDEPALIVQQFAPGAAASAGRFEINDLANSAPAIEAVVTNGTGPVARLAGRVEVGANGVAPGSIDVVDDDGSVSATLEDDAGIGDGGQLFLQTDTGANRVVLEAESSNNNSGFLTITGDFSTFTVNAENNGNSAVVMDTDAVSAAETLDEPGVASVLSSGSITITGTAAQVVDQRTITCPTAGYVLVIGTAEFGWTHTSGTVSGYNIGVSDSATTFPANQDIDVTIQTNDNTGTLDFPVTAHGLFSVTAGAHTFYLLASKNSASSPNASVTDRQLTLLFVNTAYGTVTPTLERDDGRGSGDVETPDAPWTPELSRREIAESIAQNNARVQAELAELRAQLADMKARLEALGEDAGLAPNVAPATVAPTEQR